MSTESPQQKIQSGPMQRNALSRLKNTVSAIAHCRTGKAAGQFGLGAGLMIGARWGVGLGMGALGVTSLAPLLATTALASGIVGGALYWGMQWQLARKNGTTPPKFISAAAQGLNTAANVGTFGLWEVGKGSIKSLRSAFGQRSLKGLFNWVSWRDPMTYLKLGTAVGAAVAGYTIHGDDIVAHYTNSDAEFTAQLENDIDRVRTTAATQFNSVVEQASQTFEQGREALTPHYNSLAEVIGNLFNQAREQAGAFMEKINEPQGAPHEGALPHHGHDMAAGDAMPGDNGTASGGSTTGQAPEQQDAKTDSTDAGLSDRERIIAQMRDDIANNDNATQYAREILARAENGNLQAIKDYSQALLTGSNGLEQDIDRAIKGFEYGAAQGHGQSIQALEDIERVGREYFAQNFGGDMAEPPPKPATRPEIPTKVAECTYATIENDNRSGFRIGCDFNAGSWLNGDSYAHVLIGGDQHKIGVEPPGGNGVFAVSDIDHRVKEDILKGQIASRAHEIALNAKQAKPA